MKPPYDTTLARMAGNIACGLMGNYNVSAPSHRQQLAEIAVAQARAIVAEVQRTAADQGDALPAASANRELVVMKE